MRIVTISTLAFAICGERKGKTSKTVPSDTSTNRRWLAKSLLLGASVQAATGFTVRPLGPLQGWGIDTINNKIPGIFDNEPGWSSTPVQWELPSAMLKNPSNAMLKNPSNAMELRVMLDNAKRDAEEGEEVSLKRFNSLHESPLSLDEAQVRYGMPWSDTIGKSTEENPLLYMPFWEWQMDFMKENLSNLRPHDCVSEFEYKDNPDKKARMVNQCYQSDEYRKIRMTYYDAGDSTQVFNSVWYPDPAYNLPILGIDLLSFNRKKYLSIVDFQPLHEDEGDHATTYEHRLQPIKDHYDSLKGRMSDKFYDQTQFFSQQMLFARFGEVDVVERDLFPAFQQYVTLHTKLIAETTPDRSTTGQEAVLERQRAYDTYSAERDPATALFASMFGKEWAHEFVFDFLFALSERTEGGLVIPPMFGDGGPPKGGGAPGGNPMQQSMPQPVDSGSAVQSSAP